MHLFGVGELLNAGLLNLASRKETSFYRMVRSKFDTLNRLGVTHAVFCIMYFNYIC